MDSEDVLLLSVLGSIDAKAARQVIWRDPQQVLGAWTDLQRALSPSGPGSAQGDTSEERLARVRDWKSEAVRSRPELSHVDDDDLVRLAFSSAVTSADIGGFAPQTSSGPLLASLAEELERVLAGSSSPPANDTLGLTAAEDAGEPAPRPNENNVANKTDVTTPGEWLSAVGHFADFDPGVATVDASAAPPMMVRATPEGDVVLSWPTASESDAVTFFRVVEAAENWPIYNPDFASVVGVTTGTEVSAQLEPRSAVTYLVVWQNSGADEYAARSSQPVLAAIGQIVWPPRNLSVQVTPGGAIAALLDVPKGAHIEVQRSVGEVPAPYEPGRALDEQSVHATGFIDRKPPVAEALTYAAYSVANLPDGRRILSSPAVATVSLTLEPNRPQLEVEPSEGTPGAYDLSWPTPDFGRVDVYLTNRQPPTGLSDEVRSDEVLAGQGLTPEHRLHYPTERVEGRTVIRGCHIDAAWVRGYFVATHRVSAGVIGVGSTVSVVTPRGPSHVNLVERVDSQIVTFEWPKGVTTVEAYQGPRGQATIDPATSAVVASLTDVDYVKMGGLQITRSLPPNGCSLHLFGVVYEGARPQRSEGVVIDYPGMTRLRYRYIAVGSDGLAPRAGHLPAAYRVEVICDDVLHETPFCLVQNVERLPLHPQDGVMLTDVVVSLVPQARSVLTSLDANALTRGYVRLFLYRRPADSGSVAVLDPPFSTLLIGAS